MPSFQSDIPFFTGSTNQVFRRRDLDASVVIEYVGNSGGVGLSSSGAGIGGVVGINGVGSGGSGDELVLGSTEMSLRQLLRLSLEQQGGGGGGQSRRQQQPAKIDEEEGRREGFAVGNSDDNDDSRGVNGSGGGDDNDGGDGGCTKLTLEIAPEDASALAMLAMMGQEENPTAAAAAQKEVGGGRDGGDDDVSEGFEEPLLEVPLQWELNVDVALEAIDIEEAMDEREREEEEEEEAFRRRKEEAAAAREVEHDGGDGAERYLAPNPDQSGGDITMDPSSTLFKAPKSGEVAAELASSAARAKAAAATAAVVVEAQQGRSKAQNKAKELVRRRKLVAKQGGSNIVNHNNENNNNLYATSTAAMVTGGATATRVVRKGAGDGDGADDYNGKYVADAVWDAQRLRAAATNGLQEGTATMMFLGGRTRQPAWRSEATAAALVQVNNISTWQIITIRHASWYW